MTLGPHSFSGLKLIFNLQIWAFIGQVLDANCDCTEVCKNFSPMSNSKGSRYPQRLQHCLIMANFKTHLTCGVILGGGSALVASMELNLSYIQSFSVFTMGTIGGILPDIDSDSGKPLSLIFSTISILLPALLLEKLPTVGSFSPEFLVSYFVCSYFIINYLICGLVKKITVHRGIMHSLPFSLLAGEIGYLLFAASEETLAITVGGVVFAGCLVHLILDELHSFTFKYKFFPVLKKSFGTAIKFKSPSLLASAALYCLIIIVAIQISYG